MICLSNCILILPKWLIYHDACLVFNSSPHTTIRYPIDIYSDYIWYLSFLNYFLTLVIPSQTILNWICTAQCYFESFWVFISVIDSKNSKLHYIVVPPLSCQGLVLLIDLSPRYGLYFPGLLHALSFLIESQILQILHCWMLDFYIVHSLS